MELKEKIDISSAIKELTIKLRIQQEELVRLRAKDEVWQLIDRIVPSRNIISGQYDSWGEKILQEFQEKVEREVSEASTPEPEEITPEKEAYIDKMLGRTKVREKQISANINANLEDLSRVISKMEEELQKSKPKEQAPPSAD